MSTTPNPYKYLSRKPGSYYKQLIDHVLQVGRAGEGGELAVGAGALLQDAEGVLDLRPTAQVVDHVADEPLDQLAQQVAGRELLLLAQVQQLAVEPVAHRPPLVLVDQGGRVRPAGEV